MKLSDFITKFAEEHQVQHIDELDGIVKAQLNDELYLVEKVGVTQE